MKKLTSLLVLLGLFAMPAFAMVASYENVPVVDVNCSKKAAADPDSHTRDCALKCAASGFGIVTKDQQFLKFDAAKNAKIVEDDESEALGAELLREAAGIRQQDALVKRVKEER